MARDRDLTPPQSPQARARSHMGDDERAEVGAAHRRPQAGLGSESRRRKASRSHPHGVPAIVDPIVRELSGGVVPAIEEHEVTEPWALLERGLDPADMEHVSRLRRDSDDPYAHIFKLSKELKRIKQDELSAQRAQANQLLELLGRPPHADVAKLQAAVTALEVAVEALETTRVADHVAVEALTRWWKPIRAVLIFLAVAALGAVGFFIDRIMSGVEQRSQATIRIDHLERALNELRQDVREERSSGPRYVSPAPDHPSWLQPPTKAVKP